MHTSRRGAYSVNLKQQSELIKIVHFCRYQLLNAREEASPAHSVQSELARGSGFLRAVVATFLIIKLLNSKLYTLKTADASASRLGSNVFSSESAL